MTERFQIRLLDSLKRLVQLYEATGNQEKARSGELLMEAPKKDAK